MTIPTLKAEETPLQYLNRINNEIKACDSQCEVKTRSQNLLARHRNSDSSFTSIFLDLSKANYGDGEEAKNALHRAADKFKLEIIRLAELDLQHQAREKKIKSKMLGEKISKSIISE